MLSGVLCVPQRRESVTLRHLCHARRSLQPSVRLSVVEFSFKLTGLGWGEATLSDRQRHVVIPASYLTDVLSELLTAVWSLLEGAPDARCSWELEPGEYRWLLARDGDQASLRVLALPDNTWENGDDGSSVVFDFTGPSGELASAFVDGIEAVLREYGEDGYKERWHEHPFPSESLSEVKALLHPRTPGL